MTNFNENALKILRKRYLIKDEKGNVIETPEQMLERVANVVCGDDNILKEKILEMMNDLRFLPNTPTLMNAGLSGMLSACFVIDVDDTLESIIHDAGWQQAYIHKMGGGVGINFSKLRPKGDLIKKTGGITSGVLGFLEVFNVLSDVIRQGGKRDGANMGLLSVSHPEIEEWILAKTGENKGKFRNFNLSVLIGDNFMKAVEKDLDWKLVFNGDVRKVVKAKYLYDLIVKSAWECGCPGMIFVDEINRHNPVSDVMRIECTNPCGEQPLYVGMYNNEFIAESCNLGSLNLSKYVISNYVISNSYLFKLNYIECFNFNRYEEDIKIAVEFLDRVIDVNKYPFDFIDKGTKLTRKIGLGITGLHECLVKLGIRYDSEEALKFIEEVMIKLRDDSHQKSYELGREKGNYPLYDELNNKWNRGIVENKIFLNLPERRNLFTTTCAPTGTIGRLMLGHPYSGGIEPPPAISIFSNIIDSKIEDGVYPLLLNILREKLRINPEFEEKFNIILHKIGKDGKSIQGIDEIPLDVRKLFLVAEEIPVEWHIKVQSLVQKYTDNAVSKTINMKNDCGFEDVSKAFKLAWISECKGVTIYRDNSKDKQVFESSKSIESDEKIERLSLATAPIPRRRYKDHICIMREIESACGISYNGITFDFWGIMEDFPVNSGKGGCIASQEAIGRSVSTMLRNNISPEIIIRQYHRVKCNSCLTKDEFYDKNGKFIGILSCADGISQLIRDYYGTDLEKDLISLQKKIHKKFNIKNVDDNLFFDVISVSKNLNSEQIISEIECKKCPECGGLLIKQEGCMNEACLNCGWGGCV